MSGEDEFDFEAWRARLIAHREEIVALNIPTGIPLVYELDDRLRPLKHYYLGDPEMVRKAAHDAERYERVWKKHVEPLDGVYRMSP